MRRSSKTFFILILLGLVCLPSGFAFLLTSPLRLQPSSSKAPPSYLSAAEEDPLEELDEDRKKNLFQCLLRDLQIEGTPLLECDAFQAHTLQAALWTTMAELSEQEDSQKVCLVLEGIGVEALRTFVDDFLVLKTQQRLMEQLPELQRFSIGVVGKGAGPAIVIETSSKSQVDAAAAYQEVKVNAAQKAFIDRLMVGEEVCPYTKSTSKAPQGLQEVNIQPGEIGYRYCAFSEVCHVLSAFWNCICELLSVPDDKLSCVVLSMPSIGDDGHDRFSSVAELVSRCLCLFRGDDVFETLHFHPGYDRNLIYPEDQPAHGHLPPLSWIPPMLRKSGKQEELSEDEIALSNYQRRAPFTSIVIKRVSYFEALAGSSNAIVDLELDDGRVELASGVACYANNAVRLAEIGEVSLKEALQAETAMGQ